MHLSTLSLVLCAAGFIHCAGHDQHQEIDLDMRIDYTDPKNPRWIDENGERRFLEKLPDACCEIRQSHNNDIDCIMNSGDAPGSVVFSIIDEKTTNAIPHFSQAKKKCCTRRYRKVSNQFFSVCIGHGPWFKRQVHFMRLHSAGFFENIMHPSWRKQALSDLSEVGTRISHAA